MIEDIQATAWTAFKNSGNIGAYLLYKAVSLKDDDK
jgi:hypothetical protein